MEGRNTVYKVVTPENKSTAPLLPQWALSYVENEWTRRRPGTMGIFVFDDEEEAIEYALENNCDVFECDFEGDPIPLEERSYYPRLRTRQFRYRSLPDLISFFKKDRGLKREARRDYWDSFKPDYGSVVVEAVKPIQKLEI